MMLTQLRRIIQEMNAAENIQQALQIAAYQVKNAVETEACSIFLTDEETGEYVFVATEGLNKDLLYRVRLKYGEGLIGWVAEREEPLNLDNAPNHPRFIRHSGIGEDKFHAFLGVPILHQRTLLGVLVVQQLDQRRFDESEEAFLVTVALQLAATIAYAKNTGQLSSINSRSAQLIHDSTLDGIPGAPGVAIGEAVVVYPLADLEAVPDREAKDQAEEIFDFEIALKAAREYLQNLSENLANTLPAAERGLFDAYTRILDSASLVDEIKQEIKNGHWAQGALKRVIKRHVVKFEAMEDAYLRERASDLKDLGQRILHYLQTGKSQRREYPDNTILIAEEVTPSQLVEVPEEKLKGVASIKGSGNSHVAILARAMGVPAVMGISGAALKRFDGSEVIVDGYYGQLYINPNASMRHEFEMLVKEERELDEELAELRHLPAETLDGDGISLYINAGLAADVSRSMTVGAQGVGLYRTEVPFMARDRFPTEEEQCVIYRQLLNSFAPRPVVLRTLDIGGDKGLPYFPIDDPNPFLGWRGLRVTLDQPEIFLVQIRAMIRASMEYRNMHILLPMVSTVAEVEEASRLITQAFHELVDEGYDVTKPSLGAMIEVPSAVYMARELAKRVDFISVGSNDLIQYLLAVDRNNARVGHLYDALHPAVLQALLKVVKSVKKERKAISICGEMAGDPLAAVLLLAMEFDILSMSASRLPRIKWVIRKFTMQRAKELLKEVLEMDDPTEIRCHMELALEEVGLGALIRAGK